MTERDEWSEWIDHDGRGCPVAAGIYIAIESDWWVDVRYAEGINPGDNPAWNGGGFDENGLHVAAIIRYRVRRNRQLEKLRDLVENLPADATEDALT